LGLLHCHRRKQTRLPNPRLPLLLVLHPNLSLLEFAVVVVVSTEIVAVPEVVHLQGLYLFVALCFATFVFVLLLESPN